MKSLSLFLFLAMNSSSAISSTIIKCIVPSPRNVLILEIDNSNLTGTLTQLEGSTVAIESYDGSTFTGHDFPGSITLAPGALSSLSGRTHALYIGENGEGQTLNCMKGKVETLNFGNDATTSESTGFEDCRVPAPNTGNPHLNRDMKFRMCRTKAIELGKVGEDVRRCQAICMKN